MFNTVLLAFDRHDYLEALISRASALAQGLDVSLVLMSTVDRSTEHVAKSAFTPSSLIDQDEGKA